LTEQFLHIDGPLLYGEVVQNTAIVEHIRDKSDMKVGLLFHLNPILLEEAKCIFDYTASSFVPFVKVSFR
jgi:hypothetical protein